jgi:hypothetical protein
MGAPGTKCKKPPLPRSTIRTNRAVHQRNALALSLPTVRVLWLDAARRANSVHFPTCSAVQTPQTTHRPRRRKQSKVHKAAARRRRTPNQARRRPFCLNVRCRETRLPSGSPAHPRSQFLPSFRCAPSRGSSAPRSSATTQAASTHASCAARSCDGHSASYSHARGTTKATSPSRACRA